MCSGDRALSSIRASGSAHSRRNREQQHSRQRGAVGFGWIGALRSARSALAARRADTRHALADAVQILRPALSATRLLYRYRCVLVAAVICRRCWCHAVSVNGAQSVL